MLRNVQTPEEDQQAWKSSTKALDLMDDLSDDGEDNPISGLMIIKEGKYKGGKNGLELKAIYVIYVTDEPHCEWVRHHIDKNSGKDMQRLGIYILCRDQGAITAGGGGQFGQRKACQGEASSQGCQECPSIQRSEHGVVLCGESGARDCNHGNDERPSHSSSESSAARPPCGGAWTDDGDAGHSECHAGKSQHVGEQTMSKKNRVKLLKNIKGWCDEM